MKLKIYSYLLIISLISLLSVENGIPALFENLSKVFNTNKESLLQLISWSSFGGIIGMLFFSTQITFDTFRKLNIYLIIISILSALLTIMQSNLLYINLSRFLLGISIGICSSLAWWYSFNVAKASREFNITIMIARPISIAIGYPLLAYFSKYNYWQAGYSVLTCGILIILYLFIVEPKQNLSSTKLKTSTNIFKQYKKIFTSRNAYYFYGILLINSMGYLGFFVILPFEKNLNIEIREVFIIMGIFEIIGTLFAKYICIKNKFFFKIILTVICIVPILLYILPIPNIIIYILPAYLVSTRIFILNLANSIPNFFYYLNDTNLYGACGTLIGITAWVSLGIISYTFSNILKGMNNNTPYLILFFLNVTSVMIFIYMQKRIIYARND
jgi:predicted MFS family arabinose efflux permease